jgi:hypothetical protein
MVNARRRVKGHCVVSTGTMDTILVHPREVFRLAVVASAHAIIVMHNLWADSHRLCYGKRGFMCLLTGSDAGLPPSPVRLLCQG